MAGGLGLPPKSRHKERNQWEREACSGYACHVAQWWNALAELGAFRALLRTWRLCCLKLPLCSKISCRATLGTLRDLRITAGTPALGLSLIPILPCPRSYSCQHRAYALAIYMKKKKYNETGSMAYVCECRTDELDNGM